MSRQELLGRLPIWTEAETAYIAGIVDGEGCIGIYRKKRLYYFIQLSLVNTNRELIDWLREKLHANAVKKIPDHRPQNKISFQVTVDKIRAFEVLQRIEPFVIVKREHVKLALEFKRWQNLRPNKFHRYDESETQYALRVLQLSRILNRKGAVS